MLSHRSRAGVSLGKAFSATSRLFGRGGGTAIGGLIGLKVAPDLVPELASKLDHGAVLITGTNGKTTTSHLIASMARAAGLKPLANASGSNLMRGIAGALAAATDFGGSIAGKARIGVFEVDEAVLPAALIALRPRVVVFLDLFR